MELLRELEEGIAGLIKGHRILVVDDGLDHAKSLEMLLRSEGHQVMSLCSAMKATEVARQFAPRVAIVDVLMPILDGIRLCQYLRRWPWGRSMHIIAISGGAFEKAELVAAGFDAFFRKPIDWPELKRALRDLAIEKAPAGDHLITG